MVALCEFLLMADAAVVLVCLLAGFNQWPFVIAYWAVLTARNVKVWRNKHK